MSENILEVNNANFDTEVLQAEGPVLVDFWAPWCAPCKMQTPILEEWAGEQAGKVKVAKLNTEDSPEVAGRFGISSIPTLVVFQNGQPVVGAVGVQPAEGLNKLMEEAAKRLGEAPVAEA
jgi:thioredoxin 1